MKVLKQLSEETKDCVCIEKLISKTDKPIYLLNKATPFKEPYSFSIAF